MDIHVAQAYSYVCVVQVFAHLGVSYVLSLMLFICSMFSLVPVHAMYVPYVHCTCCSRVHVRICLCYVRIFMCYVRISMCYVRIFLCYVRICLCNVRIRIFYVRICLFYVRIFLCIYCPCVMLFTCLFIRTFVNAGSLYVFLGSYVFGLRKCYFKPQIPNMFWKTANPTPYTINMTFSYARLHHQH